MILTPEQLAEFRRRCPVPDRLDLDEADWQAIARIFAAVHRRQAETTQTQRAKK